MDWTAGTASLSCTFAWASGTCSSTLPGRVFRALLSSRSFSSLAALTGIGSGERLRDLWGGGEKNSVVLKCCPTASCLPSCFRGRVSWEVLSLADDVGLTPKVSMSCSCCMAFKTWGFSGTAGFGLVRATGVSASSPPVTGGSGSDSLTFCSSLGAERLSIPDMASSVATSARKPSATRMASFSGVTALCRASSSAWTLTCHVSFDAFHSDSTSCSSFRR